LLCSGWFSPLAGISESFPKNLGHFVQLLKSVNFQPLDTLIIFDDDGLFTNVAVNEALKVIRNNLHGNDTLVEWSVLQVKAIVELLEVCLRTTYFRVDDKFFPQKDDMAVGSSHPLLATSTWSILRNWLLTWHNTNHCCGSGMLMKKWFSSESSQ
jgi:hypothetical protein